MSISRMRTLTSAIAMFNQEHDNDPTIDDLTSLLYEQIKEVEEMLDYARGQVNELKAQQERDDQALNRFVVEREDLITTNLQLTNKVKGLEDRLKKIIKG